jgi:uncharacterized CHY-type Zn-finger protein
MKEKKKFILIILTLLFASSAFAAKEYSVPYPPFSKGIFPCMNCHDGMDRNKKKRALKEMHRDIKIANHGDRWCYDCHDEKNLDKLKLANGEEIKFEESYKLCGQCHGNVLNDWKLGIHGKRMGSWNGEKQYLLCVHCHDSHHPKFAPVKPDAAPISPDGKEKGKKH